MVNKRTIFCDFDGPIVDVSERYYQTYLTGLRELQSNGVDGRMSSIRPMEKQKFWEMKQHRVPDSEIAIRSGVPEQEIDIFLSRVRELVNQPHLLHYDRIQPEARRAFHLLNQRGVRLILVTLRCQQQAVQLLHEFGLRSFFSDVYGTSDEDAAYTNSVDCKVALLRSAWHDHLHQYGRPIQSWMIGDTEADICAGQAIGIPTVAITTGIRSQSYLRRFNPTYTFDTLLHAAHGFVKRSTPTFTSCSDIHSICAMAQC
ncbi:MAG: HAD family hydrolase [Leptolyngbyaceae bacterium]|nr:HAD family hydrolase [Leptolyngbyaceae bacterium]